MFCVSCSAALAASEAVSGELSKRRALSNHGSNQGPFELSDFLFLSCLRLNTVPQGLKEHEMERTVLHFSVTDGEEEETHHPDRVLGEEWTARKTSAQDMNESGRAESGTSPKSTSWAVREKSQTAKKCKEFYLPNKEESLGSILDLLSSPPFPVPVSFPLSLHQQHFCQCL